MGIILKAREVRKKTVNISFTVFVFPYLIYCCEVWGTASNIHLQPQLQKKIIRIINVSPYNSPTKLIYK